MSPLAAYDPRLSWEQNLENAPPVASMPASTADPLWSFLGLPVASPLGVAAGPLLCGQWLLHYASLGYDILTWKTVRSQAHPCYAPPNLVPVRCGPLTQSGTTVPTAEHMQGSWAVSFGMPSVAPRVWIEDIRSTRRQLPPEKLLVVSVVGTQPATARLDDLADDYARCAVWAAEAGADVVEMNFSCPNVSSVDGQLFQHPRDAAFVAARVRQEVPDQPLIATSARCR